MNIINLTLIFLLASLWGTYPDHAGIRKSIHESILKKNGWIWLFDGSNTDHWRLPGSNEFPQKGWTVEGDLLITNKGGDKSQSGGSIITREKYGNFDLRFEFNMTPGVNSGLKYFVKIYPGGSVLGCEYQIIDDHGNKDIAEDVDGKRLTAGLYELFEAKGKKLHPPGQWNSGRIVVKGDQVEHWLNGKKVLQYERGSQAFLAARAGSKFSDVPDFGLIEEGHILLQDHGDEVAFRNIKIKVLE